MQPEFSLLTRAIISKQKHREVCSSLDILLQVTVSANLTPLHPSLVADDPVATGTFFAYSPPHHGVHTDVWAHYGWDGSFGGAIMARSGPRWPSFASGRSSVIIEQSFAF